MHIFFNGLNVKQTNKQQPKILNAKTDTYKSNVIFMRRGMCEIHTFMKSFAQK